MTFYGQVALEMTQWAIFRGLGWLWVTMLLSAQRCLLEGVVSASRLSGARLQVGAIEYIKNRVVSSIVVGKLALGFFVVLVEIRRL